MSERYIPHALAAMVVLLIIIVALLLTFGLQHAPEKVDPYTQAQDVLNNM